MNISIIGTGNFGAALGKLIANHTRHPLTFGTREPKRAADVNGGLHGRAVALTPAEAARSGDLVILATPFSALAEVGNALGGADSLAGKVLVDASNPLTPDYLGLTVAGQDSAGEAVARAFPGARVVKAFNTVFASVLASHQPGLDTAGASTVFVAGDDAGAKAAVVALADELGFDALDAGALANSRYLEPALEQMIQLAFVQGLGTNLRLRVLRG